MARMKIESTITDDALLQLLGARLAARRIAQGLTQDDLASQAGLGLRTVQRLEKGETATQLSGFVRVCRVLGLIERFGELIPDAAPSPMALLKHQGKERRRASRKKTASAKPKKWTWGDPG